MARESIFLLAVGDMKNAEEPFRLCLAVDEWAFNVYFMLGEIQERQQRPADALLVYRTSSFMIDGNPPRVLDALVRWQER